LKLLEGSGLLNEDAQKLRDNATLLDELSNKLEQKAQYFKSLADNASMKAYMGSGFTPLVVQRNKALYSSSKVALSLSFCASSFNKPEPSKSFVASFV
jgi:hypothetical protein